MALLQPSCVQSEVRAEVTCPTRCSDAPSHRQLVPHAMCLTQDIMPSVPCRAVTCRAVLCCAQVVGSCTS